LLHAFKSNPQLTIADLRFLQEAYKDNRLAAPKFRAHTFASLKSSGLDKDAAALQGSNPLNPLCAIFTDAIPLIAKSEDDGVLAAYGAEIRNLMGRYSKAVYSAIGTLIDRKVEFLTKANEVAHLDPELQEILLSEYKPGQRVKCLQNYLSVRGRINDDA